MTILASASALAVEALASNRCGSSSGLDRMLVTATLAPPIWLATSP
jgi:hypothetical protein